MEGKLFDHGTTTHCWLLIAYQRLVLYAIESPKTPSKTQHMNTQYTAVVKKQGEWWIGWIEEIPGVNCQELSKDTLMESLRITLREALELNRDDAITAAGDNFEELGIAL